MSMHTGNVKFKNILYLSFDGDGETNGDDPEPYDPCIGGELANVDLSDNNTDWYLILFNIA